MGTSRVLLYLHLSFAIVEITHGVTANRDDTDFHHAKPQILKFLMLCGEVQNVHSAYKYTHFCQAGNHPGTLKVTQSVNKSHGLSHEYVIGTRIGSTRIRFATFGSKADIPLCVIPLF